jgi:amino acid adenylation domain-containing protein
MPGLESMSLVHAFLDTRASQTPDAIALVEPSQTTTYAELDQQANRFAHLFRADGVRPGDRVVIALENSAQMVAAYLGAMKAGAVAVPLTPGPRNDRLRPAVADCEARVVVTDPITARLFDDAGTSAIGNAGAKAPALRTSPDASPTVRSAGASAPATHAPASSGPHVIVADASLAATLEQFPETAPGIEVADTSLAAIIYTSGSTGEPRGVMLTHRNFVANARAIVSYLELTSADRVMCVLPFSYVYGLSLLHTHLAVGGSVVIDNRFAFPNVVLDAMRQHRVTGFAGVPSTFALLLHRSNLETADLPDLRYVTQAGGAMPASRIQEWRERGPRAAFFVMYGATEAAARLTYLPPARLDDKLGSIGRPIPGVEIVVVNDSGEQAAPNEVGELVARGDNISSGYWNRPDETAERFGPSGYRTGDLGYADDEGFLYIVGRRHDMMKVGAYRVGAKEIEDVLHQHAAVSEAAVVAAPHDLLGEAPVAFVAFRRALACTAHELRGFCAARLEAHKVPVRITVLPELPKLSGAGKVDRRTLAARAAQPVEAVS